MYLLNVEEGQPKLEKEIRNNETLKSENGQKVPVHERSRNT